jgi:hypothetical protein
MSAAATHLDTPVTRDDIESKLRELQGGIEDTADTAKSYALAAGAAIVVTVAAVAFILGRRRGKKKTTVVEIRRV